MVLETPIGSGRRGADRRHGGAAHRLLRARGRRPSAPGERYGLIRFGSRVDVYLPAGTRPRSGRGPARHCRRDRHRRSRRACARARLSRWLSSLQTYRKRAMAEPVPALRSRYRGMCRSRSAAASRRCRSACWCRTWSRCSRCAPASPASAWRSRAAGAGARRLHRARRGAGRHGRPPRAHACTAPRASAPSSTACRTSSASAWRRAWCSNVGAGDARLGRLDRRAGLRHLRRRCASPAST